MATRRAVRRSAGADQYGGPIGLALAAVVIAAQVMAQRRGAAATRRVQSPQAA
jgi:hypothetical protein